MDDLERQQNPLAIVARYQGKPPVDLTAIARDLKVSVLYLNLGADISGQIMRDPSKGGFVIWINNSQHPNRQRFTLAHEISHYILHRDLIEGGIIDDTMYRSSLSSFYEAQANRMAADILMPIMPVKRYRLANPDLTIKQMADTFQVSEKAMEIRLRNIFGPSSPPTAVPKQTYL